MASNNANPVTNIERYWESMDLITKALTNQDGPFSWEGKHFTHRHVNIWPRPWQAPHPRMWAATGDPDTASEVGRRGMVNVLVLRGPTGRGARGRVSPGARGGRPARGHNRPLRVCRARLRRRHARGGRPHRQPAPVVPQHELEVGAAVLEVPAWRGAAAPSRRRYIARRRPHPAGDRGAMARRGR